MVLRLWDDALLAESGEEVEEAVVSGLVIKETELSALAHVSDDFDWAAEIRVRVPGRDEDREVRFYKMMLFGNTSPDRSGIGELLLQRGDLTDPRSGCDTEPISETRPHPVPTEDVTVDYIECLILSCWIGGGPLEMTREEAGVGHIGEAIPLHCGTRKQERATQAAAEPAR